MEETSSILMWQIIAVILTALAIIVSVAVYFKQRRRKSLEYEIVANASLVSVDRRIRDGIKLTYNDEPVEEVRSLAVKIINTGNEPIKSEDYERPLSINYGKDAKVLTVDISEANPKTLQPSITKETEHISIDPLLLNPDDTFIITTLVNQFEKVRVDGRIVGIKKIREILPERLTPYSIIWLTIKTMIVSSIVLIISYVVLSIFLPSESAVVLRMMPVFYAGSIAGMIASIIEKILKHRKK